MNNLEQNTKSIRWKEFVIPSVTCIAFALLAGPIARLELPWLISFSATPLLLWLIMTRVHWLVTSVVFLIPLSIPVAIGGQMVFGFPSEILIALLTIYLVFVSVIRPFIPKVIFCHPLVLLICAELAWMFVCSAFSNDPLISFKRVFIRSLFVYLFIIFGTYLILQKGDSASGKTRYHWLFLLYGTGLAWPALHTIINHSQFGFTSETAYRMCNPFYTDHTIYGACIAFVLPMMLILTFSNHTFRLPFFSFIGIVLLTALLFTAEVLSFSRAAWISGLVAGVFGIFLLLKIRLRAILALLLMAGIVTWSYRDEIYTAISKNETISSKGDISDHFLSATNVQSDASNTERINRWVCAWKMAIDKPVFGFGPGMYQFEYGRYQDRLHMTRISTFSGNKGHAHSEYFTQLSETGFPGFLLFLIIVFSVIGYGMYVLYNEKDPRLKLMLYGVVLGLVTFYVHGIFNAFLDTDKMAVLVFGSIAIIVASHLRQQKALLVSG